MRVSISYNALRYCLPACLLLISLTTHTKSANAQDNSTSLDGIIIESFADKNNDNSGVADKEKAQSTPTPSTVISRKDIEDGGIQTVEEAVKRTPNFMFSNIGSPRITYQSVRGIGNSFSTNYFNNPIGIYVDGVPISAAEFNRSVGDAQSIEVIRGPSGTMSGHNAIAGSIHITTRAPTNTPKAEITGTVGNNGQLGTTAFISGPIVKNTLSGRGFFEYTKHGGFTNYAANGEAIDDLKSYLGSGSLRFTPNANFMATLHVSAEHRDEGGYAYQLFNSYKNRVINMPGPNGDVRDARSVSANARYKLGKAELMTISAYRDYSVRSDQNMGYNLAVAALGGGAYSADEKGEQRSQELRLTGKSGENIKWLFGGLYLNETHSYDYNFNIPAFGPPSLIASDYERNEFAGYGEATVKLLKGLELTAGIRVTNDRHEFQSNAAGFNEASFTNVTPKFRAAYRFDADRLVYISATRGARSGGFNRISSSKIPYDNEYLWSYEAGLKSQWLNKSLTFNAAAFYINWTDQQVQEQIAPGIITTTNASKSHSQGFEMDANWRPISGLELSGFVGVTIGEYDRFIDANTGADYSGNQLINTPKFSGGAAIQYKWALFNMPLKGMARLEYKFKGDHYFDFENRLKQSSYGLVNARLGVENARFSAGVFVKNLFDTDYRTTGFYDNFGPGLSQDVAVAGPSRLIGVEVKTRF